MLRARSEEEREKPMSSALHKNRAAAPLSSPKTFSFAYLVHDVSRMRREVMNEAMRPLGVTSSHWVVLSELARGGNDGMMQADLARLLEVGKVTLGALVDRLEAMGHVERRGDAADLRIRRVYVTGLGFEVIGRMAAVSAGMDERMMRNVAPDDQRVTQEVMFIIKQNLKEMVAETARDG